jgi:hypothetical protein
VFRSVTPFCWLQPWCQIKAVDRDVGWLLIECGIAWSFHSVDCRYRPVAESNFQLALCGLWIYYELSTA